MALVLEGDLDLGVTDRGWTEEVDRQRTGRERVGQVSLRVHRVTHRLEHQGGDVASVGSAADPPAVAQLDAEASGGDQLCRGVVLEIGHLAGA